MKTCLNGERLHKSEASLLVYIKHIKNIYMNIVIDKHIYDFTNMTNLKCIIFIYIFIIINSIYLFIYIMNLVIDWKAMISCISWSLI